MNRRPHLFARCLGAALASTLVFATVLIAAPTTAKVPRAPHRYSAAIDPLAGYTPQQRCSPTAKRGTTAFANMLLRTYRSSTSLGIVRSCGIGGASEHKEGRAFDWGVSIHSAADRRAVNSVMRWLLKTDKFGNRYAMARRLGIQYMIWNRRIWGSYSASSGWRRYTGASPHTDHVHFSLSWKGARKKTTFWNPRRAGAPKPKPRPRPTPAPKPRPKPKPAPKPAPKPRSKPLPEPTSPRRLAAGTPLVNEQIALPVRRRVGVTTQGALQAGRPYLVEVSGSYRYAKSRQARADAECSTAPRSDWDRHRSVRRRSWDDHLEVYVDGNDLQGDSDNASDCDTDTHTYRWIYQPTRDGRVPLRIWDPVRHNDNAGKLDVRITDLGVRNRMSWRVPANAAAGVTSPGSLQAGVEYDVVVAGTWRAGGGVRADAECSTTTGDSTWRRERDGDHDVLLDRDGVRFDPVVNDGGDCNIENHAYRYTFTPGETRPVNLRVDDFGGYGNNRGALRVRVAPHVEAEPEPAESGSIEREQITVDAESSTPVRTKQSYPAGTQLLLKATGTFLNHTRDDWYQADAECSREYSWNGWREWSNSLGGHSELAVNGASGTWTPEDGSAPCDESGNAYWRTWTVEQAGPLSFVVTDDDYSRNRGSLTVTVEEAR
ncbi:MAG TPA: hypothetical protein VHG70_17815 [Nocardioidaceae bacterium]|nr:hypothetical protein [Nocardioidaceae bacterium]